jgi:hypothetical protein
VRTLFLQGAEVVASAVADERVAAAWDRPSFLEDQTVGGLASHVARGGIWVVHEYLDQPHDTTEPDIGSAVDYYVTVTRLLDESAHAAVRARGAALAAEGHAAIATRAADAVEALAGRLAAEPADRLLPVYAGRVMTLDDYLVTRIIEQVVHLDDLARSLGIEGWPVPDELLDVAFACALGIARRRRGDTALLRALYRDDATGALPVL